MTSGKTKQRRAKEKPLSSKPLEPRPYCSDGYWTAPRRMLGSDIATYPAAFTLLQHFIGWANFCDTKVCRTGELPIGFRDLATRLGWAILTVKRALRWLEANGWITTREVRTGPKRGTIVTVIDYARLQNWKSYERQDQKVIPAVDSPGSQNDPGSAAPGSQNDPGSAAPGSQNDPSVRSSYTLLLLLVEREHFARYFAGISKSKERVEKKVMAELLEKFEPDSVDWAFQYVRKHPVPVGGGQDAIPDFPLAYLGKHIDRVLKKREKRSIRTAGVVEVPEEVSVEELQRQLEEAERLHPTLSGPLRRLLQQRQAAAGD